MNITLKNTDAVNAIIKIDVVKADYTGEVEKTLKNLRQNASIPGFRKGMVPMGYVKKMYEKSAIVEQVNKVVSNELYKYIRENKLNVLGEPLSNETEQKTIDFDKDVDFEFCFDIALAPEIKIELNKKNKLPYYTIEISDEMVDKQLNNFKANYGEYKQVDEIEGKDMAKGLLAELNADGQVDENGIQIEDAVLMPSYMKDDEEKAKFTGAKLNTVIVFNPYKAYEGAQAELSSLLKISKDDVEKYKETTFSFEIKEVTRYAESEINQALFDKVFGEGVVKTEEEFKVKIKEMLAAQTTPESDYKFLLDARSLLMDKAGDVTFPDAFLKRWLLASDEKRTPEALEEDYPKIIEDLKFHLIKEQIIKENEFKVEDGDIMDAAKKTARAQFAQYGMANVSDEIAESYAKEMLKKEDAVRNLVDRILEEKIVSWLKETVKLDVKEVSVEEFQKLFQ